MPTSQDLEWVGTLTLTQMNLGLLATRTYKVTDNHPRDSCVMKSRSGLWQEAGCFCSPVLPLTFKNGALVTHSTVYNTVIIPQCSRSS